MVNVFIIVVIAGCYGGIFKETRLLDSLKSKIQKIESCTNPFVSKLATSMLMACVTCNQTLTIVLTHQLTSPTEESTDCREHHALDLYDSAVTVIALVPWSVATTIVLVAAQRVSYICCLSPDCWRATVLKFYIMRDDIFVVPVFEQEAFGNHA